MVRENSPFFLHFNEYLLYMEYSELIPGDWVRLCSEYVKVVGIGVGGMLTVADSKDNVFDVHSRGVCPVSLTNDILVSNRFRKVRDFRCEATDEVGEQWYEYAIDRTDWTMVIYPDDMPVLSVRKGRVPLAEVNSIHELQHIFFAMGVGKKLNLW